MPVCPLRWRTRSRVWLSPGSVMTTMSTMAWIHTIHEDDAEGELKKLYERVVDPATGRVDNVMKIHSVHPEGLNAHFAVYDAAMKGTATLPKVDREMIAAVVSRINDCHY